jgi:hypothetical protein
MEAAMDDVPVLALLAAVIFVFVVAVLVDAAAKWRRRKAPSR